MLPEDPFLVYEINSNFEILSLIHVIGYTGHVLIMDI